MKNTPNTQSPPRILIVEDEVLIADNIIRHLKSADYEILPVAPSYEDAVRAFAEQSPDLVLLDIRLATERTGIDVANHIRASDLPIPFIFLTSQFDDYYLALAQASRPAGYLTKPFTRSTLLSTIVISLPKSQEDEDRISKTVQLRAGHTTHLIALNEIRFVSSDHVYVEYHLTNDRVLTIRQTLSACLEQLPETTFVRIHRSHVVNRNHVEVLRPGEVEIAGTCLPVSRTRRQALELLLS